MLRTAATSKIQQLNISTDNNYLCSFVKQSLSEVFNFQNKIINSDFPKEEDLLDFADAFSYIMVN